MAINRYVKDYRIVEEFNARGRVKTSYEYIGEPYYFTADKKEVSAAKKKSIAACVAAWICFIAALIPVSVSMHTLYIAVPFAFAALPLGILTDLIASVFSLKEPLEHRQADRLNVRFPLLTLSIMVLDGMALLGILINLIRGIAPAAGDAVFIPCAAALWACGGFAFRQRAKLAAQSRTL